MKLLQRDTNIQSSEDPESSPKTAKGKRYIDNLFRAGGCWFTNHKWGQPTFLSSCILFMGSLGFWFIICTHRPDNLCAPIGGKPSRVFRTQNEINRKIIAVQEREKDQ